MTDHQLEQRSAEIDDAGENSGTAAEKVAVYHSRLKWFGICGAVLLLADQLSKLLIVSRYQLHESTPVIPDIFSITYVRNHGAAWGMFAGHGWFLLLVAVAVVGAMLKFFRYLTEGYFERELSLFMILSGVFGNSIDRVWRGSVVDFLDFHYKNIWSYPVFNIADIAICCGVGIFILSGFMRPERKIEK
jgi:signal peptidase II